MRPRNAILANACGLVVGLLVLTACGGGGDLDSNIDHAVDRVQLLEDDVDQLELDITTSTTAVPPPATLPTLPPTTRAEVPESTTTTETTLADDITDASEAAILALVGEAAWDASLPIPSACASSGSFTPSGELGANGGAISCTVDAPSAQVEEYYRFALTRAGFRFSADGGDSGFAIAIGSQASITGSGSGDRTTLTIEQRFP